MFIIKDRPISKKTETGKLEDYTGINYAEEFNAFIGSCGDGPEHDLYLITHSCIFYAADPSECWSKANCRIIVEEWVDIEINIIN